MQILIKNGIILCPKSKYHLKKKDVYISNGRIKRIGTRLDIRDKHQKIEAKDLYISMGFTDLFADYCDPGFEQKENLSSGMEVAGKGGFTDVCLLPDTSPVISGKSQVEYIKKACQHAVVNLHPIGSATQHAQGESISEMYDMSGSGAILFGDGKNPIQSAAVLLKVLQYLKTIDGTLIQIPQNKSLTEHSLMHESEFSHRLGMPGQPDISEQIQLQRDITLCEYAGSKIHFTGISSQRSLEYIRAAKKKGLAITSSVTPYHLILNEKVLEQYDSNYKVFPPLRTEDDRKELLKAVKTGLIDCVSSHHFPQDFDAKQKEFEYAEPGMNCQQTCFNLLVKAGLNAEQIVNVLSSNPRAILKLPEQIEEDEPACLTLFSMDGETLFDRETNASLSANNPFLGQCLPGKIIGIINNNKAVLL